MRQVNYCRYFYFRDHNMAAYPNLKRLPGVSSSPFFARRNPGFWVGGPIKKDRLFFFFNYEYMNQVQAISIQTTAPSLQALQGTYGSPYLGKQFSLRLDYHINSKETLFIRHSHDGNSGRGQSLLSADPGSWTDNFNWADQSIIGLTSALTTSLVNDFRGQYNYWNNKNYQAVASDCSLPCVAGSGLPTVYTLIGTNLPAVGPNFNAPQGRNTRRYEVADNLSWQHASHRFKFGADFNLTKTAGVWGFCLPMCVGAWSEEFLKNTFGSTLAAKIAPDATGPLSNDADVLNLPVYNTTASIFSGVGVGAISTPAGYSYDDNRWGNQYRVYAQDVWKIRPNFTFNYGFAWNAQTGYFNAGIPNNPQYLAPILGSDLRNPSNSTTEFEPALGFAWSPFKDNKTVIRGGAGIYWDTLPWYWKLRSEPSIGPPGNGRSTLAASAFTNIYPGIVNFLTGKPLAVGANLDLGALYNMSIKQFMALVNQELPAIQAQLAPSTSQRSGPFSVTGIDIAKQGVELFTSHFPMARSYQTSLGIQRDVGHGIVVTADWARRQGENVIQGEVDRNLTNRYLGSSVARPVIPSCAPSQLYVPGQECSAGSITFWTAQGRQVYDGLLVKANKRMSNHFSFVASYAFQKNLGQPSVVDDLNYARSYGEILAHHDLNVNGLVDLPWGFTLSINSAIFSRTPATANVASLFLPGTVPQTSSSFPLPGIPYGGLNAGTSKADLQKAVDAFNATYAGTKDAKGGTIAPLALPPHYQFGDPFFDQDVRLTKVFSFKERYKLNILAEMFNVFNIANLTNYGFTLDSKAADPSKQTYAFGQPTQRIIQTFGPGGPRAVQVAARLSF